MRDFRLRAGLRIGTFLLLGGLVFVAACSGNGAEQQPAPPASANQAPIISAPNDVAVAENVTAPVLQVSASDPEGSPLTYTLSGNDAARFTISNSGALSFAAPPNFEAPGDADQNNVYVLNIVVSDGQLSTLKSVAITVTNLIDDPFLRQLSGPFSGTVQILGIPGSTDLFLVKRDGAIVRYDPTGARAEVLFLTVADVLDNDTFGVRSMALAPDFATSGTFYILVNSRARNLEVRRYGSNGGVGNPATADVIFSVPFNPQSGVSAETGWIGFGPDAFLYVLTGTATDDGSDSQNPASRLGKVLRVDVRTDAFPADPVRDFAVPADNPNIGGAVTEVFARGLGYPQQASFNGSDLLFDDRRVPGEINLLRPQDKGGNFGFGLSTSSGTLPPVIVSGDNNIAAGLVYRGPIAALAGLYIYGGGLSGVFSVPAVQIAQGTTIDRGTPRPDLTPAGTRFQLAPVGFAADAQGNAYFFTNPSRPSRTIALFRIDAR